MKEKVNNKNTYISDSIAEVALLLLKLLLKKTLKLTVCIIKYVIKIYVSIVRLIIDYFCRVCATRDGKIAIMLVVSLAVFSSINYKKVKETTIVMDNYKSVVEMQDKVIKEQKQLLEVIEK